MLVVSVGLSRSSALPGCLLGPLLMGPDPRGQPPLAAHIGPISSPIARRNEEVSTAKPESRYHLLPAEPKIAILTGLPSEMLNPLIRPARL